MAPTATKPGFSGKRARNREKSETGKTMEQNAKLAALAASGALV